MSFRHKRIPQKNFESKWQIFHNQYANHANEKFMEFFTLHDILHSKHMQKHGF